MADVPLPLLRVSRGLFWLAGLALVAYPMALMAGVVGLDPARLASLLAAPLVLGFLWQARAVFGHYAAGRVLSLAVAGHVRRAGQFAFAAGLVKLAEPTVGGLMASVGTGQVILSLGISEAAVTFLMLGGLLLVVGWATVEGAMAQADAAGFV